MPSIANAPSNLPSVIPREMSRAAVICATDIPSAMKRMTLRAPAPADGSRAVHVAVVVSPPAVTATT